MMKALGFSLALAGAAMVPAAVSAQDAKPAAAPQGKPLPGSSQADIQRGATIVRMFTMVLNSDKVDTQVKGQLLQCLYNNPVRRISVGTGRVLASSEQLEATNPTHVYMAAARVCGVRPVAEKPDSAEAPAEGR